MSLAHARAARATWMINDDTVRPHGAVGPIRQTQRFRPVASPNPTGPNGKQTLPIPG